MFNHDGVICRYIYTKSASIKMPKCCLCEAFHPCICPARPLLGRFTSSASRDVTRASSVQPEQSSIRNNQFKYIRVRNTTVAYSPTIHGSLPVSFQIAHLEPISPCLSVGVILMMMMNL